MKILKQWADKKHRIDNRLYELPSGVKFLHSINPATVDVNLFLLYRAGSYFDTIVDASDGTSHFLEHILALKPNSRFKSREEMDRFDFGDKDNPEIVINGYTSKRHLSFYGDSSEKGLDRIVTRLKALVDYPVENFKKFIEEERNIIIAERSQYPKLSRDASQQYKSFLLGDRLPEFKGSVLGEVDDISSISSKDLETFFKKLVMKDNMIVSLQSRDMDGIEKKLLDLDSVLDKKSDGVIENKHEDFENFYDIGYFEEKNQQGIFVSFNYYRKKSKAVDYQDEVLLDLLGMLLWKVGFDVLRDKHGLIYNFKTFTRSTFTFDYEVMGFKFGSELDNFEEALEKSYDVIFEECERFLKSDQGRRWFESAVSGYVFPRTQKYSPMYAQVRAAEIIEGREIYIFENAVETAQQVKVEDLLEYLKSTLQTEPPHIWAVSPHKEDKIVKTIKDSSFDDRWSEG